MTTTKISYDAAARDCDTIDEAERRGWPGERISLSAAGWYRIIDEDDGLEGVMADNFRQDVKDAAEWLAANREYDPIADAEERAIRRWESDQQEWR